MNARNPSLTGQVVALALFACSAPSKLDSAAADSPALAGNASVGRGGTPSSAGRVGSVAGNSPGGTGGSESSGGLASVAKGVAGSGVLSSGAGGSSDGAAGRGGSSGASANVGGVSGSAAGGAQGGSAAGTAGSNGDSPSGGETGDPKFLIFLLLGQSNMEGAPQPQAQDRVEDPRVRVLGYDNCPNVNRTYNEWDTASPPLHSCGAGVGPGDYFAKTLLATLPEDYSIGLVPCAVNGAPIDVFRKGVKRTSHVLPPDNHWETGYEWIVSRANVAKKLGVIRGILFHQGESNDRQDTWVEKVRGLVTDLRTDLALGEVPFLAGELYHRGCCPGHNALVKELVETVPNAFLVSADGLNGTDQYHFDLAGQRELGKRYAAVMQNSLMLP